MTSSRHGTGQILDDGARRDGSRGAAAGRGTLPSVSVILPFLNAADTIAAQLSALRGQTYPGFYEVVASDNGSIDDSRRIVERLMVDWSALRLVDASACRGVSYARNAGLAAASGDIVLGCDADDIAAGDWIEVMVGALVERQVDVVGGRFDEVLLNPQPIRSWFAMAPKARLQVSFGVAPVATGANFGAWRAVARRIGGWDTRYVGGGEDIVFSWRAQELGYRVVCVPDAVMHRRRRPTLAALARQSFRRGRQVPRLMRDFRRSSLGCPRFRRGPAKSAARLVALALRAVAQRSARGEWVRIACTAAGILVGRSALVAEGGRRRSPDSEPGGAPHRTRRRA